MAKSNFIVRGGADFSGITKGFNKLNKQTKSFQSDFGKIAKGLGLALSGVAITHFIKDSTKLAMGVESSMDNISRNMKNSALVFDDWVQTQSKALGMAKADAYNYGSTFSNLLGSFQKDAVETANSTQELMKAAAIISSKTGRTYEDTANRIRSGMLGSTEAIEDLGIYTQVSMLESTEAFKKFANGKSWAKLNFQTQQQIRLAAILEQTYKRYGNTLADTTQTRHSQFLATLKNIKLNLGQSFLPIYNFVLPSLTALASKIEYISNVFAQFTQALFGKATGIKTVEEKTEAIGDHGDAIEKAGKQAQKAIAPFDEINQINFGDSINLGGIGSIYSELNEINDSTGGLLIEIGTKAQEMANKVREALELLQPFFKGFKDAFGEFGAKIKEFNDTHFSKWLTDIGNWMKENPETLEKLGKGLGYVAIGLAGFKTLKFLADITGISKLVGWLINLKGATGDVNKKFGEKNDLLGKQTKQTTADTLATMGLGLAVIGLLGGLKKLGKYLEENPLKLPELELPPIPIPNLQPVLQPVLAFETEAILSFSRLGQQANQKLTDMQTNMDLIVSAIKDTAIQKYNEMSSVIETNLETHKINVGVIAQAIGAVFAANIGKGLTTSGLNVNTAVDTIQTNLQILGQNVGKITGEIARNMANNLGEGFNVASQNFSNFASTVGENLVDFGTGFLKASAETAKGFVSNMVSGFSTVWSNFRNLMSNMGQSISGWFKENKEVIVTTAITAGIIIGAGALALAVPATIPYITGGLAGLATMPALAEGGITGINDPFAAVIGDNRTQREVVAPLDDLMGMITSAVGTAIMQTKQFDTNSNNGDIYLQMEGTTFARLINPYLAKENQRVGNSVIIQPL